MKFGVGCEYNRRSRRYMFRHYLPGTRGKSVTRQGRARNEVEARAKYAEWLRDLAQQAAPPPPAPLTLREFTDGPEWAAVLDLKGVTASTRAFYEYALVSINPVLGDQPLEKITSKEIDDLRLALKRAGKSETTQRAYCQAVIRILRGARKRHILAAMPDVADLDLPPAAKPQNELSPEEEQRLLEALDTTPPLKALVVVGLETGLRRSDLLGLTWRAVDWEGEVLHVVQVKTGEPVVVPIFPACRIALEWCRDRGIRSMNGAVLLDHRGLPWTEQVLKDAWNAAKKRAGITRRFRLHDLRHTFACRLASDGVSLPTIQVILGHRSPKATERYARVSPDAAVAQVRQQARRRLPAPFEVGRP